MERLETFMEQQKQREGFKFGTALNEETKRKLLEMKKSLENREHSAAGSKS